MQAPLVLPRKLLEHQSQHGRTICSASRGKVVPKCELADADLVHSDPRNTNLRAADLQRANLSRSRLDGADLMQTFASAA